MNPSKYQKCARRWPCRLSLLLTLVHGFVWQLTASVDSVEWYHEQGLVQLRSNPDAALFCFERTLVLASDDPSSRALSLNRIGVVHKNRGDFEFALVAFRKSLRIRQDQQDSSGVASVLNNIGTVHKGCGDYDSALYYALESLKLRKAQQDLEKVSGSYLNLGNIYSLKEEWGQALFYYTEAQALAEQQDLKGTEAIALYNQAGVHLLQGMDRAAETKFMASLALEQQLGNQRNEARILNALGVLHENREELDQAEADYREALAVYERMESRQDVAIAYLNLGNVLRQRDLDEQAEVMYLKSSGLATQLGQRETAMEAHRNLSELYEEKKDWQRSLEHFRYYATLRDSLNAASAARAFSEIQEKYASEQKQRLIESQQTSLEAKTFERNALLLVGGTLIVLIILIVLNYRQKARNKALLVAKRTEEQGRRIALLMREKEVESMESMLNGQTSERQRIARDLHDQLGGLMATIKMNFNSLEGEVEHLPDPKKLRFQKANEMLDLACREVRLISHDMAAGMLVQFGLLGALNELCQGVRNTMGIEVNLYINRLDERLPDGLEREVYRVVQELISNALKHSGASELTVQLTRNDDVLNLLVEDNGQGFKVEKTESKDGLGLKNIAGRVTALEGTVSIDSTPRHGTTVVIDIPISRGVSVNKNM